jgi:hypothetical protein
MSLLQVRVGSAAIVITKFQTSGVPVNTINMGWIQTLTMLVIILVLITVVIVFL